MQQKPKLNILKYDVKLKNKTIPVEVDITESESSTDEMLVNELVNYILAFEEIRKNIGDLK